jgi:hypothetical protein
MEFLQENFLPHPRRWRAPLRAERGFEAVSWLIIQEIDSDFVLLIL